MARQNQSYRKLVADEKAVIVKENYDFALKIKIVEAKLN